MDLRQQKKKKKNRLRNFSVIVGAIIFTTLAVNATDNLGNLKNSILGSAISSVSESGGPCDEGMVPVSSPNGDFCIDEYEVSANESCLFKNPKTSGETQGNLIESGCFPESKPGKVPWTHISQTQAIEACAKAGKHLPSNSEWFMASLGTPDKERGWNSNDCNVSNNWNSTKPGNSGSGINCKSSWGAYDMIGNVWEWTFETVSEGNYKGIELPEGGFVDGVNEDGVPTKTSEEENSLYYLDRHWIDKEKNTAIFRGGFWGNGSDAGRYAFHSEIPTSFSGEAVGFRCAK
jgi:formylglycine-generating enzyme required for sulfatase activity